MQLDDKQSIAAGSLDRSMIVTAGAGSGKTRVLVERYLRLITREEKGAYSGPEKVVAITFTEKAASEMRSRVERSLRKLIHDEKDEERQQRLKSIMERLPQARISTIDSFCMSLVRKYPLHAGAHPEFSVIEPGDAKKIKYDSLKEALVSVIGSLGPDEKDELGKSITEAFNTLSCFIKAMESRINSRFTSCTEPYKGDATGIGLTLTKIRDEAIRLYEEKLGKMKALDFALMEDRAVKLLSSPVGNEIREGIDYVLVDEYQDINRIQDRLIRNMVAPPQTTMEDVLGTGKLFMVGDVKQSIYRFRGAEPKIFESWIKQASSSGNYVNLENNYRSNPVLIEFNNRLFGRMMEGNYEESKAGRGCFNENGRTLVHVLTSPKGERKLLCENTVEKLIEVIDTVRGRDKDGNPRKLSFKDFAVLTPTNLGIDPYAEALERRGIPVVIYKSGAFYQSDVVAFIMSLLSTAMNDTDDIAAYQLLASPAYCIREASLASLSMHTKSISAALCSTEADLSDHFRDDAEYRDFLRARDVVMKCRSIRSSCSTQEMLETLSEENELENDILSGYGRRGVANFRKLIELASNAALSLGNVADFLKHLQTYRDNGIEVDEPNILDDDEDAVKLMTIHKAKGLEFPVVILGQGNVNMEGRIDNDESKIVELEDGSLLPEVKEDHERYEEYTGRLAELQSLSNAEKQRLMYVAATRAEELLIISGNEASKKKDETGAGFIRKPNYLFKKLDETSSDKDCDDIAWFADMAFANPASFEAAAPNKGAGREEAFVESMLARCNDRIVRFSPSSLMSYISCPKEYLRRHWYRLPEAERKAAWSERSDKVDYRASDLGTIVHFIAQRVECADDMPGALRDATSVFNAQLGNNQLLLDRVKSLSQNYSDYISKNKSAGKVMKEVGFNIKVHEFFLDGIMDRLEQDGSGGWIITDLKTNNLDRQDAEQLKQKYEIQLFSYILAASRTLGSNDVKARLLFLTNNHSIEQEAVSIASIEEMLHGIMSKASLLPEECLALEDACKGCGNKAKCQEHSEEDDSDILNMEETDKLSDEI